jgi:hypothetical protein
VRGWRKAADLQTRDYCVPAEESRVTEADASGTPGFSEFSRKTTGKNITEVSWGTGKPAIPHAVVSGKFAFS